MRNKDIEIMLSKLLVIDRFVSVLDQFHKKCVKVINFTSKQVEINNRSLILVFTNWGGACVKST